MFNPSRATPASALDQGMREHLAGSLERIGVMAGAVLNDVDLAPVLAHIRAHRIDPGVFARYYDLVFALQSADYDAARTLWLQIASLAASAAELELVGFGPKALGEDAERFTRLLSIGAARPPIFLEPPADDWPIFVQMWSAAMALLEALDSAWADEILQLTVRVIAAVPGSAEGAVSFSGGSSMMTWGALIVNAAQARHRIGMLVIATHETTHQVLFGVSREEPLLTNPVEERYATELRPVMRPMNAVFHSTYVSGRTALLCRSLMTQCAAELSPAELQELQHLLDLQLARFDQGYEVIDRHARLTPLGRRLIDEARSGLSA